MTTFKCALKRTSAGILKNLWRFFLKEPVPVSKITFPGFLAAQKSKSLIPSIAQGPAASRTAKPTTVSRPGAPRPTAATAKAGAKTAPKTKASCNFYSFELERVREPLKAVLCICPLYLHLPCMVGNSKLEHRNKWNISHLRLPNPNRRNRRRRRRRPQPQRRRKRRRSRSRSRRRRRRRRPRKSPSSRRARTRTAPPSRRPIRFR